MHKVLVNTHEANSLAALTATVAPYLKQNADTFSRVGAVLRMKIEDAEESTDTANSLFGTALMQVEQRKVILQKAEEVYFSDPLLHSRMSYPI